MIAMILAAGKGERLRPITESVPKALVQVGGRNLIERHLEALANGGVETVVINLGWLGEQIQQRIGSGHRYGLQVVYSDEGENILETGGGIHRALPLLGKEPFVTVNADILTDMPLPPEPPGTGRLAHLQLVPRPPFRSQGDFGLEDDWSLNNNPDYVFSGVASYRPEFFAGCEPGRFSVAPLLRNAIEAGHVSGSLYKGYWADVGTPERLSEANALLS